MVFEIFVQILKSKVAVFRMYCDVLNCFVLLKKALYLPQKLTMCASSVGQYSFAY